MEAERSMLDMNTRRKDENKKCGSTGDSLSGRSCGLVPQCGGDQTSQLPERSGWYVTDLADLSDLYFYRLLFQNLSRQRQGGQPGSEWRG
jgi:hypothetical protein